MGKDFKANEEFTIPDSNFADIDVQSALNNGLITSVDNVAAIKVETVRFKNLTGGKIIIGGTNIRASAYGVFDVPLAIANSTDITDAVRGGLIAKAENVKSKVLKNKPGRKKKTATEDEGDSSYNPFQNSKGILIARPDLQIENVADKLNAILDTEEEAESKFFADKKQAKEKIEKLQKILNKKTS